MPYAGTALLTSVFWSSPHIHWDITPSVPLSVPSVTHLGPEYHSFPAARTRYGRVPDSNFVISIPRGTKVDDWSVDAVIVVQMRRVRKEWVATTWLEGVIEYGNGASADDSLADLIVSIGEYRESLERRAKHLGDSALSELSYLQRLISRIEPTR